MRHLSWICALTLACAVAPSDEPSTAATSDDSSTSSTSTSTTDSETSSTTDQPVCNDAFCTAQCGLDECGYEYEGVCHDDGTCSCLPTVNCLPCEACPPYEQCYGDYTVDGECLFECYHEFPPFAWDGQCTISLPTDLPDYIATFINTFFVKIDDLPMPHGENCDDPAAWLLDPDVTTVTLCSDLCAAFEQAGALIVGWGFPCE